MEQGNGTDNPDFQGGTAQGNRNLEGLDSLLAGTPTTRVRAEEKDLDLMIRPGQETARRESIEGATVVLPETLNRSHRELEEEEPVRESSDFKQWWVRTNERWPNLFPALFSAGALIASLGMLFWHTSSEKMAREQAVSGVVGQAKEVAKQEANAFTAGFQKGMETKFAELKEPIEDRMEKAETAASAAKTASEQANTAVESLRNQLKNAPLSTTQAARVQEMIERASEANFREALALAMGADPKKVRNTQDLRQELTRFIQQNAPPPAAVAVDEALEQRVRALEERSRVVQEQPSSDQATSLVRGSTPKPSPSPVTRQVSGDEYARDLNIYEMCQGTRGAKPERVNCKEVKKRFETKYGKRGNRRWFPDLHRPPAG